MTDENNQIKFFLYENWARTKTGQHTVIIKCWPILHFILAICSRRQLILRASISALVPLYLRFIYLDLWFLLFRIALLTKADIVSLKKKKRNQYLYSIQYSPNHVPCTGPSPHIEGKKPLARVWCKPTSDLVSRHQGHLIGHSRWQLLSLTLWLTCVTGVSVNFSARLKHFLAARKLGGGEKWKLCSWLLWEGKRGEGKHLPASPMQWGRGTGGFKPPASRTL